MAEDDLIADIPVRLLQEICDPTKNTPWGYRIAPGAVRRSIRAGKFQATPWKSFPPHRFTAKERQYHIERVAYLVVNAWVDPIDLDVGIPSLGLHVDWMIIDGNHRFYAAILRRDPIIRATLSGCLEYAEEIFGIQISR
jgi:hypothetical protein